MVLSKSFIISNNAAVFSWFLLLLWVMHFISYSQCNLPLFFPEEDNPGCYKSPSVTANLPPSGTMLEHLWIGSAIENWIVKFLAEEQLGIHVHMMAVYDIPGYADGIPDYNHTDYIDMEYWVWRHDVLVFHM